MNDDCQSPLDVARAKGHSNVVRTIEVCLHCNSIQIPMDFSCFCGFKMIIETYFSRVVCRVIYVCSRVGCGNSMDQDFWNYWLLNWSQGKCKYFIPILLNLSLFFS